MAPVLYCCLLAGMPGPAVLELIEPREFLVQVGPDEQKAYRYRLFRPRQIEKNRLYPLIVWLHGYGNGEFEAIGVGQLNHVQNLLPDRNAAENAHFFFLALQCPTDQRGFFSTHNQAATGGQYPEPGEVLVQVVHQLLREDPIDPKRVTLVGISGGANAAWELAGRYPGIFAGVAPMGGGGPPEQTLQRLKQVPIWAFHTKDDLKVSSEGIIRAIDRMRSMGGRAYLTLFPGSGHSCWEQAFSECDLRGWLLSQEQGARFVRPPGFIPWTALQLTAQIGLPLLIMLAIIGEVRRRKSQRKQTDISPETP